LEYAHYLLDPKGRVPLYYTNLQRTLITLMSHFMKGSRVRFPPFLCVVLAFLSVVVTTDSPAEQDRPMLDLKSKDPRLHTEQGYASVLFWRLRLEDRTGDCAAFYPRFTFGPPGSAKRATSGQLVPMTPGEYFKTHFTASAAQGRWEKKGEAHVFDGLYAVEARPGPYEVFQFKLHRKKEEFGSLAFAVNLGEQLLDVAAGQLLYLGEINIIITLSKERGKKGLLYNFLIREGDADPQQCLDRDLEQMKRLFPGVVAAFPGGASTVPAQKAPVQTPIELRE
jgi:hypothetical protein